MAVLTTSLLKLDIMNAVRWDGGFRKFHLLKPGFHVFRENCREFNSTWHRKLCQQLIRGLPLKGSSQNSQQSVDSLVQSQPLVYAQSIDDEQPLHKDQNHDIDTVGPVKDAYARANDRGVGASQVTHMESTSDDEGEKNLSNTALKGTIVAGLLLIGAVGGIGVASYVYKEQINTFLVEFSDFIDGYGVAGYALFVAAYAGLEVLAIPAIPLTMSAGLLFGTFTGTIIVSISGTIAATTAFLIARYLARDRILKLAAGNKKFLAIDKAIGENSFQVVTLLRLSPLLPFSLGNYLYGLTSVKLLPYVLGSWLGMLPGTWAYVSAGAVGRAIIQQEAGNPLSGGHEQLLTLGIGLLITVTVAAYVTQLAKDAIKDID